MAGLRDTVKDFQDELRDGIAWVAFWKEGRSWNAEYFHLDMNDTLYPEDRSRLEEIKAIDPAAVILNGYYCGHLGGDMNLDELTAGVRYHYENSMNDIDGFIGAHDDRLPPELIEEARAAAHAAGLPFSEKPYRDGEDFDPYVFDGSMSIEDYELMHRMIEKERRGKMSEQFSILIDSRSRFDTGEPGGAWLPMPATKEQLHEAMQSVGISAENPQDFFINGFANTEDCPFDVPLSVIQSGRMDELNYLAALLDMLRDGDREKFAAAVTLGERAGNLKDLINLAQNLDCYWIYPTVQNEEDYGYYLINELDELELPEEAKKYFMYEEYGRDAAINDGGRFTDQGYIYNNKNTFSEWYNGRDNDIPQEYRIMSYPQPEQGDPEQADFDAVPTAALPAEPRPVIPIIPTSSNSDEKLKEVTDRLEQGITELFDSERYADYLRVMSKFPQYSLRNTVLIAMQAPDASHVMGFDAWKDPSIGRHVKANEKGIRIIAPIKVKRQVEKIDPETKKPVLDMNGKPVIEKTEVVIPKFKVVCVYDVAQTEGKELPTLADELTGDVEQYRDFFAALEKSSPFPIAFEVLDGGIKGRCNYEEQRISIREGMSELQNIKTAIHEIAHATLHDTGIDDPERLDRRTREVQAESVAYAVCQHYGLDTSDYSFGYVAGWSSGRELAELKSSLETIRSTAAKLIETIDGHFAELQKEQETAKEQETEMQSPPDLSAEPTVTILWSEHSRFHDGETMSLSEANALIGSLDEAAVAGDGYYKTKFRIDFVMDGQPDYYVGRQDLGDGDGTLIEHIEDYHAYYENNEEWDKNLLQNGGAEALEADKAQREMLLHEFVPFLKLHDNLSKMEQTAAKALEENSGMTSTETAYYTAMREYVSKCRTMVNSGEYHLPPVPQLKDFDTELNAYKEHVKEEIAQEATDAGMTVEEYAANGFEPYAAPEYLYKVEANPLSDGIHDRFLLQAYEKEDGGKAIPRDVLFIGTPEKCRELLEKLETGELSQEQAKELFAQTQETAQTTEPQEPEKADTPEQTADKPLTDLQKKSVEIVKQYENLPMRDKIGVIAQAFGGTTGKIETSPCTGKWRGTSDVSIKFDNGVSLFIGNHRTPQAKTVKVQNEDVNSALVRYNPEIIAATKETAIAALRKREAKDNEIATQKGLKPYTLLNVEFNDGTDERSSGHLGWYYVTLAVDGKICSHIETGLNYDILDGKISDTPARENYFVAGALKETDVDYVFNNVGFSSTSELYSLPIRDDVLKRAEKALAEREETQPEKAADIQTHTVEPQTAAPYYTVNEAAARRAKEMNSYSDYKPGSATAEYQHYVDEAVQLAERQKKRVDPSFHEKIDGLLDTYARKLAANMNKGYEIDARVPSILIAGGSNFPVRKKEKQNAARDSNYREWQEIQGLLDKIRSTGMGGISADDPNAIEKLEKKLAGLEKSQETMKAVNAYYRKHKTLDGCPHIPPESIEKLKSSMESGYHLEGKPYPTWALSNNNAEIRRVKQRIAALTRRKEIGYVGWEFEGGKVEANEQDNRLQIFFDEKPDADIRTELKGSGFKWSPSAEAWQRQLNDNAIYAADRIKCIAPLTGESPTDIQKRARQEAAAQSELREHDMDAPPQEQPEIPVPDATISVKEMQDYGYSWDGMFPLKQEAAERLFTQDGIEVFRIYEDGTEGAVTSLTDLQEHAEKGGLFGVEKETWEALHEYNAMKQQLRESEPSKEALLLYGKEDSYGIYQLARGDATRDLRFEPYERLQAAGHTVDRANYELIYTAPLTADVTLNSIWETFNIDHPEDFKGHSLSVSDIVVLHQNGENTAHYVDSGSFRNVPEFLQEKQKQLTPDDLETGETIRTPRGTFHVTAMSREQMEAAGYGLHHQSGDGKYMIMGNGTRAFAIAAEQPEKVNPLKHVEDAIEQNDNNFDGIINNTPTVDELEAKVKAGEQISLVDLAEAVKADKERSKEKPSIRAQLKADKERAGKKKNAKTKNHDLEV